MAERVMGSEAWPLLILGSRISLVHASLPGVIELRLDLGLGLALCCRALNISAFASFVV